jgi:hypothetical protein
VSEENKGVEMIVGQDKGYVVLKFKEPVDLVEFEPQNAIDVAMAMTDAAFECRDGVKPAGETLKAELIERHRMTLTNRFAKMIGTMRMDIKRTDGKMAQELVEAALKEIF